MMRRVRATFLFIWDLCILSYGLMLHLLFKKRSPAAYQALIRIFCRTQGKLNDLLSRIISCFYPPQFPLFNQGVLGNLNPERLKKITCELDQKGYFVFEQPLDPAVCDRLLQFSLSQPAIMKGDGLKNNTMGVYRRNDPEAVRYQFTTQSLVNEPAIQELMVDPSIVALSQSYLRTTPILDLVVMWWHTTFQKEPDAEAAQFFHFDMDRPKWLKFFFYLTDVSTLNGPHCFISGTHRTGGIPKALLNKGYARLTDQELAQFYDHTQFIEFTGRRGTIIAEDTRGFHKGKVVETGDRLVFQLQYSNSLFGSESEKLEVKTVHTKQLKALLKGNSRIRENFAPSERKEWR